MPVPDWIRHHLPRVAVLALLLALPGHAQDARPVPLPSAEPIPVHHSQAAAEQALAAARIANRGLVSDLTLGQDGHMVQAVSTEPLPPGRYRVHALVASTEHDHILAAAVTLYLTAGSKHANVERKAAYPKPGVLQPVHVDVTLTETGPLTIAAGWWVGDAELDTSNGRSHGEARRIYLKQREAAINQWNLRDGPAGASMTDTADAVGLDDLMGELEADKPKALQPRDLAAADLPRYRLVLAGLQIEALTPVTVATVSTDRPAYAATASGRLQCQLRNTLAEPVDLTLRWSVADDDTPDQALASGTETLTLQAGETREHTIADPFPAADIAVVGRARIAVSVPDRRPSVADTPFVILPPERPAPAGPRDKRIFAHYMACWPIGYAALPHERRTEGEHLKHESTDPKTARGGHVRNYPIEQSPGLQLTPEESADLEIQRAMRIGIDGFAIDAWAGGENAMKTFDALIRTAEAKDYPFTLTLCIDPSCGGTIDGTVQWLLDNYGDSPKLARRDGKPLIFGYFSQGPAWRYAQAKAGAETDAQKIALRNSPLGWHLAGAAFADARRRLSQDVHYNFGYGYLFHPYLEEIPKERIIPALGTIARYVDSVGTFGSPGPHAADIATAVKASGAEWSGGIGMYQKENIPFELFIPPGTEWLEGRWAGIRAQDATLPQLITWNDYGENSNIAPGYETRYTLYDLTAYHIQWWKTGTQPVPDHDRVYLTYAKYPRGARVWPFAQGETRKRVLEVLTILPSPATIRLPGRDIEFDAPAGYSRRQFPLTPGPVIAELLRDGQVTTRLESPEPITDRPFREQNGFVCFSTEFMRHWRADFGDAEPFLYGEYADDDADGLPNWYEMYFFSQARNFAPIKPADDMMALEEQQHPVTNWLDFSTMTLVDPAADPDRDGRTNLQEYHDRTDPTVPAPASQ